MYLAGDWYCLIVRSEKYNAADVMAALGVSILTDRVLQPILDIIVRQVRPHPGPISDNGVNHTLCYIN